MGQRNIQYTSQLTDLETDQRGLDYILPEPCIFYGSFSNFSGPNIHPVLPAPGNTTNLSVPHPTEHHDSSLFFGMTHYNGFQHQHPARNLDLAGACIAPPSASRDFPVRVNHGANEQVSFSSTHGVVGIPTDSYGGSYPYMDGVRESFKRKNAEGFPGVFPYQNGLEASSSSVPPMGAWPVESDVDLMDGTNFAPPDYGGNATSLESHRGIRNRAGIIGSGSILAHNANHVIQGSYVVQPFRLPGNPWLDMHLSNNGRDNDSLAWNQAPALPYLQGSIGGGRVEAGIMGIQSYQISAGNRSSGGFLYPHFLQRHPNLHHLPQPMRGGRGHSMSFPQATSSRSTSINPFQGVVETGPRYMGPVPPTGFRLYWPHQREDSFDMNARHRNLPHLRVLPEDGVAMLEVPAHHEAVDSVDQHRDMRLDIDHMSYEELLALGEQIGSVTTGISEEVIASHLKTRSLVSSATRCGQEEAASTDKHFDFCVICQTDYKDQEIVGTLDCGHEYHVDCMKKWLLVKNTCPICKSTALNTKRKDNHE